MCRVWRRELKWESFRDGCKKLGQFKRLILHPCNPQLLSWKETLAQIVAWKRRKLFEQNVFVIGLQRSVVIGTEMGSVFETETSFPGGALLKRHKANRIAKFLFASVRNERDVHVFVLKARLDSRTVDECKLLHGKDKHGFVSLSNLREIDFPSWYVNGNAKYGKRQKKTQLVFGMLSASHVGGETMRIEFK